MKKLKIKPYILKGIKQPGDYTELFRQLQLDSIGDRLAVNYRLHKLNLGRMYNFNFVMDGDEPVQVSGTEICSDNVVRVFSRYYVFKEYRTDSKKPLDKTDDFQELQFTLSTLDRFPLVIWSRDKNAGFFKRLKKGRPDLFENWHVHDQQVELMYKENFQSIFYTGDISYLDEVIYDHD